MTMKHKKWLTAGLAIVFLMLVMAVGASATEGIPVLYAEPVAATPGAEIAVPIYVENNNGIMGFKVNVRYDSSVLQNPSITRGDLTSAGMFNDSIGGTYEQTNEFFVLWSSDADVTGDGTLFVVHFQVAEDAIQGEYPISLTYSPEDTFNEAWEDVAFTCQPIMLTIQNYSVTEITPPESTTTPVATEPDTEKPTETQPTTATEKPTESTTAEAAVNPGTGESMTIVAACSVLAVAAGAAAVLTRKKKGE